MIHQLVSPAEHQQKQAAALRQFKLLLDQGQGIAIKKNVKHIFKERDKKPNLDLRHFNRVLSVDTGSNTAVVEGMTTFYNLVDATLPHQLMPQAVPELRSITVGGVIAGLGGQSSSFKFGLVHEMVTEFDLLTGRGDVLHCSPDQHPDLFHMLPNSYGSLGYVLKCTIKLNPIKPYVRVQYDRFPSREAFFEAMLAAVEAAEADFVEGVSFRPGDYTLLAGSFADTLPPSATLLRPLRKPFFQTIQDPAVSQRYLTTRDYIWRWDPDAFWATDQKNLFGDILLNPLFRRTLGPTILRSDRLVRIGKIRNRLRKKGLASRLFMEKKRLEALIQDAAIPFDAAVEFDAWLAGELRIYPLWYCPVKTLAPAGTYPLYQPRSQFVVDFGFYLSAELEDGMEPYYHNRRIEEKLLEVGGFKCLYSDTFFSPEQFWSMYDRPAYEQVKAKYDPHNTYLDIYQKVINKA
jgi:FAD/FMN-containing dehydrogenase